MKRREAARQVLLPGNSGPLVALLSVSPHSSISLVPPSNPLHSLHLTLFHPRHHHKTGVSVIPPSSRLSVLPLLFISFLFLTSTYWVVLRLSASESWFVHLHTTSYEHQRRSGSNQNVISAPGPCGYVRSRGVQPMCDSACVWMPVTWIIEPATFIFVPAAAWKTWHTHTHTHTKRKEG